VKAPQVESRNRSDVIETRRPPAPTVNCPYASVWRNGSARARARGGIRRVVPRCGVLPRHHRCRCHIVTAPHHPRAVRAGLRGCSPNRGPGAGGGVMAELPVFERGPLIQVRPPAPRRSLTRCAARDAHRCCRAAGNRHTARTATADGGGGGLVVRSSLRFTVEPDSPGIVCIPSRA
jgi:hypothetical protein